VAHKKAGELSYGQQKLVDIAMAFMSEPDLVLLDEPCAGVNPSLVGGISTLLKQLNQTRASGKKAAFVVIEHNMDFVMDLCHRILVMVEGQVLAVGTPDEIRGNKQCSTPISGTDHEQRQHRGPSPSRPASPRGIGRRTRRTRG
jgi:branched-chain amino acid transport system ATP-binding protein